MTATDSAQQGAFGSAEQGAFDGADQGAFGTAMLVLADGRIFPGRAFGARGRTLGEGVFATGMTGYQETATDPSYRRQIVVATAPQIGNTGWVAGNDAAGDDSESGRIQLAGLVVRDLSPRPSNWRATGTLPGEMARQGIIGISEVDTRALTRHLRDAGAMSCGIFSAADPAALPGREEMLAAVRACPPMLGADLVGEVATAEAYLVPAVGPRRFTVAVLDLGVKSASPRQLAARGVDCHVLPASATIADIAALGVDGVFLSNGPGDPATADAQVALVGEILRRRIPLFGICFGNQILGRALGLATYKLTFGHRGINQPVRDEATGRVLVTAHNHGFAVRAPSGGGSDTAPSGAGNDIAPSGGGSDRAPSGGGNDRAPSDGGNDRAPSGGGSDTAAPAGGSFDTPFGAARVAFTCLNDGVVEGLECLEVPAFSVQFHPEAAAGPHDAEYLFDRFLALMDDPAAPAGAPQPTERMVS